VQRYILEKSKQEAYDYLAKFGKLIRMVLNNSEEKTLPLQQELEMLKLYVELEQMRFSNSFEFKITIAEDVNPFEIQLPAMLIQPYIENAIWHGLMNLNNERKGILKVEISVKDELLKIVIEDNGIGRKRAEEYKETSVHSPKAMKLTEQRIMMINQMKNYESAKVVVSDLTEGTRVEILLPI
jgi:LytS/YehU family sensor histidine kinase